MVSTHDHDLPLEVPIARTLLIRSCNFDGQNAQEWEADELTSNASIDDTLKRDLLGARRKILFVEGTEQSLDKSLYSIVFPMVSVIPKGSCREVEAAVQGSRAGEDFHWLRAFGIADGDGYDAEFREAKRAQGVYMLPYYSVESIYYHPEVISRVAIAQSAIFGGVSTDLATSAINRGIEGVARHTERLSKNAAKRIARKLILEQIPNDDELISGRQVVVNNSGRDIHASIQAELDTAIKSGNWETILNRCSIRECEARENIIAVLGFRRISDYEKAVRHLLANDTTALGFVRGLFGNLSLDLEI